MRFHLLAGLLATASLASARPAAAKAGPDVNEVLVELYPVDDWPITVYVRVVPSVGSEAIPTPNTKQEPMIKYARVLQAGSNIDSALCHLFDINGERTDGVGGGQPRLFWLPGQSLTGYYPLNDPAQISRVECAGDFKNENAA